MVNFLIGFFVGAVCVKYKDQVLKFFIDLFKN